MEMPTAHSRQKSPSNQPALSAASSLAFTVHGSGACVYSVALEQEQDCLSHRVN